MQTNSTIILLLIAFLMGCAMVYGGYLVKPKDWAYVTARFVFWIYGAGLIAVAVLGAIDLLKYI